MLELRDLTCRYGAVTAVDRLSLQVAAGELLVLVGTSGCGKTTTLKMINRLIEPSAGSVLIEGADVATRPRHELRRQVGYVFQKVGLFPHLTVAENIAVTPSLLGWPTARQADRVAELLSLVELELEIGARYPHQLSGGQQQRVGVARALAAQPRLMLLDEPFGALDPVTRDRLQVSFQRIRRELALTAIFVTHDMLEALLIADRIAVMRSGRLVQVDSPSALLANPADDEIADLLAIPRRQVERLDQLRATENHT